MEIIFEDEVLLVLLKPAGLHSTRLPTGGGASLADELLRVMPSLQKISDKPEDAGLIQRLDEQTSGLIVATKTRAAWQNLRESLRTGKMHKAYRVLLEGKLASPQKVDTLIGGKGRRSAKVSVYPINSKKPRCLPAHSEITPVHYYKTQNCSLARVKAATARRHQVRAHCASIGHPLVGDGLYGSAQNLAAIFPELAKQNSVFYLDAFQLAFTHPVTRAEMNFSLDLPSCLSFGVSVL
jgi:23S rRNA pseudouridine1911/1915/1917 synthase